jgi:hypothetical protein
MPRQGRDSDGRLVITMLGITYLAEIVGQLTFVAGMAQLWPLPFLIYLNAVDTAKVNRWVIYAVTSLLLSYPNGESPMPCHG